MLISAAEIPALSKSEQQAVLAVLPRQSREIARLARLSDPASRDDAPVVTVVGKYNHGKSRLLNELLGSDAFLVADRRETSTLAACCSGDVRWLDAPGLDADVHSADDTLAEQAVWRCSDVRLFVHAAKGGELDAAERRWLDELCYDAVRSRRSTLFVMTQVDQLADEAQLQDIQDVLRAQLQTLGWGAVLATYAVSATRHRRGVQEGKRLLVAKSGLPELQAAIAQAVAEVPAARSHEHALLHAELTNECESCKKAASSALAECRANQCRQRKAFEEDLAAVLDKVSEDLREILLSSGPDRALEPDSFVTMFKVTAGKRERARLQIAYSRACIEIDGVLIKHGVTCLPKAQRVQARSLNSLVVAVMGVSVKYREDLRKIFAEEAGRARLQREFGRYFALSEDQCSLVNRIAQCEADLVACGEALAVLRTWKPEP
ncbi:GTPase Der [Castellaniella denitrificans]|uniref:GTPase n=1 Tax=Castellaniella sp. TaxID=1955812 RepID=UPI003D0B0DD7